MRQRHAGYRPRQSLAAAIFLAVSAAAAPMTVPLAAAQDEPYSWQGAELKAGLVHQDDPLNLSALYFSCEDPDAPDLRGGSTYMIVDLGWPQMGGRQSVTVSVDGQPFPFEGDPLFSEMDEVFVIRVPVSEPAPLLEALSEGQGGRVAAAGRDFRFPLTDAAEAIDVMVTSCRIE